MMRKFTTLIFFVLATMFVNAQPVTPIQTPNQGRVPEIAQDKKGVLHLTYGKDNDAFYVQSHDGGKSFSAPVKLNQRPDTVTVGGERGAKIVLGKNGMIHVVWLGHYRLGGGVWYTRSTDGGRSFAPERNLQDTSIGCDSPTIVADSAGNVLVFWLDARLPKDAENPVTDAIILARSTNHGETFTPNEIVKYDFAGRACACCRLEARLQGEDVYIAFRTGYHNIRDFYLLKGRKLENNFQAVRVSDDKWQLEGCPMSGADFQVANNQRVWLSWMSEGKVYWSTAANMNTGFALRLVAPAGEGAASYPMILANRKNEVFLLWKQEGKLRWAHYAGDEKFSNEQGIVSAMPGKDKAVAFVGSDNKIYVVLTN